MPNELIDDLNKLLDQYKSATEPVDQCANALIDDLAKLIEQTSATALVDQCPVSDDQFALILDKWLSRTKKTLWLSAAGAIGSSLIHLIAMRLRKDTSPEQSAQTSPRTNATILEKRLLKVKQALNRSAVASSSGFLARVGINMITGGSDIWTNTASRVVSDTATKATSHFMPAYTGRNEFSWTYTISRAATSAAVGTLTYYFSSLYASPTVSRCLSAGASTLSEQTMDYFYHYSYR